MAGKTVISLGLGLGAGFGVGFAAGAWFGGMGMQKPRKPPLRVLITGAAGQIGYALCPMVAAGRMLGPDQPVILHLLDIEPAKGTLEGLCMELIDAAYPLLVGVALFTSAAEAAKGVDVAVMVGGVPRKAGEERKDVMAKNVSIYKEQASALANAASPNVKVVVVANPANTNAFILSVYAPSIPRENITCLTRLDHNRARGQIAKRTGAHNSDVKNVIIWGNHSSTQYPDVSHGTVKGKSIREVVKDDVWLDKGFIDTVQQRGAAILKIRGLSSALSAASSVCDHIHDWVLGTPVGEWVSMGVVSKGDYGTTAGLVFSFPVSCKAGTWTVVKGLTLDAASQQRLHATEEELLEERDLAQEVLAETK
eukprot:CAMPEP_0119109570 /NCGR_PEP_ID=MMETSP1180-20130426/20617_1 /TAXON_ID=3052 ORGANISM="Chlamydomonas cf sp, Strain CCMP681" /NCGR_SAMPLE_ID=MMETSP1180 /ASSEMBLY_ACC=CAM_ASM_000741 /LENGTH=365 /DNA_ID=CAMNT_0007095401 /DNA_START=25 /DNA_END=1122 /DNA_ORIENTATION=+